jgi:hypothetical protein
MKHYFWLKKDKLVVVVVDSAESSATGADGVADLSAF